jgi:hypothetical protein
MMLRIRVPGMMMVDTMNRDAGKESQELCGFGTMGYDISRRRGHTVTVTVTINQSINQSDTKSNIGIYHTSHLSSLTTSTPLHPVHRSYTLIPPRLATFRTFCPSSKSMSIPTYLPTYLSIYLSTYL